MITKEGIMDIIAMHRSGLSVRNISRTLGIHRKTVKVTIQPLYYFKGILPPPKKKVKGFFYFFDFSLDSLSFS